MPEEPILASVHSGAPPGFWRRYVFSTDHKVIGVQYFVLALFSVVVGILLSLLIRLHLAWPQAAVPLLDRLSPNGAPNGVMTPEYYLSLLTLHGTLMVFFVLTTAPQSAFGNYFLPIQLGAREMAFPRLNMLSFWITAVSLGVLLSTLFVSDGPPLSGWTAYPPLSALGSLAGPGEGMGQTLWIISIALFCVAAMLSSLNVISTTLDLRTEGMTLMRMPLTCWSWFIAAIIALISFAVLLAAGVMLLMDRMGGTSFFVPSGLVVSNTAITGHHGGSPLLWQHLFWFFGHPEVYIAILPGMGLTSHILSIFSRKPVFGYRSMVYALALIGLMGFMVWGHHMFVSGMSPYAGFAFSLLTMAIAVPSTLKALNWLGTLMHGRIRFNTPMLFALGFVSLFVTGGLSGIFLAQPPLDLYLHDSYFVVAHLHFVMGLAAIFGIFEAVYFWFPKMFGRMMNETLGRLHFFLTFAGAYAIFMPMHFLGLAGNPRRYADLSGAYFLAPLAHVHLFITLAAFFTGAAQLLFFTNLVWSLWRGPRAVENPWQASTLEWSLPSPPPPGNFPDQAPVVYHEAYLFNVPGAAQDFIMQHVPFPPDRS